MRGFFSYALIVPIVFASVIVIPVERFFDEIGNTDKLIGSVRSADTYKKLLTLTVDTLMLHPSIKTLGQTPLALNETELRAILMKTFPEDWFYTAVRTTHQDLMEPIQKRDPSVVMFGKFLLNDKKELLNEYLVEALWAKWSALPPCSPQETMALGMTYLRSGAVDLKRMPITCRPPKQFEQDITRILRTEVRKGLSVIPDTVDYGRWFNQSETEKRYDELKDAGRFFSAFQWIAYSALIVSLLIIALINRKDRKKMAFRIGIPAFTTGFLLSASFGYIGWRFDDPVNGWKFKISGTADISGNTIGSRAIDTLITFLRSVMANYIWDIFYFALFILILGLGLMFISRILHNPTPAEPYRS